MNLPDWVANPFCSHWALQLFLATTINIVTVYALNRIPAKIADDAPDKPAAFAGMVGWATLVVITIVPVQFFIWGAKQQMHGNLGVAVAVVVVFVTGVASYLAWRQTMHAHAGWKIAGLVIAMIGIIIAGCASNGDQDEAALKTPTVSAGMRDKK